MEICHKCNVNLGDGHMETECLTVQLEKAKASANEWRDAWYHRGELIGKLCWQHNAYVCPHQTKLTEEQPPKHWLYELNSVVRMGNSVYGRVPTGWKLLGAGKDKDAAEAVHRLMSIV